MSFIIKDPQLLKKFETIVKIGQTPPPLPAQAPVAPAKPPSTLDVAKYLFVQLGQTLNGMPDMKSENPAEWTGPKPEDLKNIDNFAAYLEKSKLVINGKRLAYKPDDLREAFKNNPQVQQEYYSVGVKVGDEMGGSDKDLGWGEGSYKVNFEETVKYIAYLQRKASNQDNKVLEVMVGRLIEAMNKIYKTGLTPFQKSVPGQAPNQVPDNITLDSFPSGYVLNPWKQTYDPGTNVELKSSDLQNAATLNDWIGKNSIQQAVDAKGTAIPFSDPKWNFCNMINALFWRANYLWNRKTPDKVTAYGFYVRKLQEISRELAGPDGKACTITTQIPGVTTPAAGGAGATGAAGGAATSMTHLLTKLPFRNEVINVSWMRQFNDLYLSLADGEHKSEIQGLMDKVNDAIAEVHNNCKTATTLFFPVHEGSGYAREMAALSKVPDVKYLDALFGALEDVVNAEKQVVQDLLNSYGDAGTGAAGPTRLLPQQVSLVQSQMRVAEYNVSVLHSGVSEWRSFRDQPK
jgi:hypothetical protein